MAALGAGGFIVGFTLQETLGSFASGLMIMVYPPFDVDDYVSVAGVEGTAKEMSLVSTTLSTIDNRVVVVPNKIDGLADSLVNLVCRPWVKTSDFWTVHWDLTRQVKERFDTEGISIPFPQRDVHVNSESTPS